MKLDIFKTFCKLGVNETLKCIWIVLISILLLFWVSENFREIKTNHYFEFNNGMASNNKDFTYYTAKD